MQAGPEVQLKCTIDIRNSLTLISGGHTCVYFTDSLPLAPKTKNGPQMRPHAPSIVLMMSLCLFTTPEYVSSARLSANEINAVTAPISSKQLRSLGTSFSKMLAKSIDTDTGSSSKGSSSSVSVASISSGSSASSTATLGEWFHTIMEDLSKETVDQDISSSTTAAPAPSKVKTSLQSTTVSSAKATKAKPSMYGYDQGYYDQGYYGGSRKDARYGRDDYGKKQQRDYYSDYYGNRQAEQYHPRGRDDYDRYEPSYRGRNGYGYDSHSSDDGNGRDGSSSSYYRRYGPEDRQQQRQQYYYPSQRDKGYQGQEEEQEEEYYRPVYSRDSTYDDQEEPYYYNNYNNAPRYDYYEPPSYYEPYYDSYDSYGSSSYYQERQDDEAVCLQEVSRTSCRELGARPPNASALAGFDSGSLAFT